MDARAHDGGPGPAHQDGAARPSASAYRRHRPEETVLYQVVEAHAAALFAHLDEHESSLPRFVREEFEAYLGCGRLERGFVRAKCTACRHEYLAAFSCRRRGWCPSCGARRMVDDCMDAGGRAKQEPEPRRPRTWSRTCCRVCRWPLLRILRSRHSCIHACHAQWVLTFPWPLRLLFAAHPEWLTRVLGIVTRALSSALLQRAGYRPGDGAQTGIVTFI